MTVVERPGTQRFDTVDVLRGVSILAVVLLHIYLRMFFSGYKVDAGLPAWLGHLLLRNGDNGVTVFFAVSGFLITLTSMKRFGSLAEMRPGQFYRIRFARIAPLLLALLAVLSVLHLAHVEGFVINPKRATLSGALFSALTFHLNWYEAVHGYLPANWDVLWSLSVEEMFYLFFPLICLLLLRWRRGLGVFIALLLGFVVVGPFARTIFTTNEIWQEKTYLGGMDAIALGCLTALLTVWAQRRVTSRGLLIALQIVGVVLMAWVLAWPRWQWLRPASRFLGRSGLDGTVLPLGVCLVIFASVVRGARGGRATAALRWFGRHSYEVYMTHEFIVVAGTALYAKTQAGPIWVWVVAMVVLTAPLGWVVGRYFSEPLNRRLRGGAKSLVV